MIEPELGRLRIALGISVSCAALSPVIDATRATVLGALQQHEMLAGLAYGIMLTAEGRAPVWIKRHGFVKMWPVRKLPGHGRQLQGIYNTSLMAGIAHGRRLAPAAAAELRAFLLARVDPPTRQAQEGNPESWTARQWEACYRACGDVLLHEIKRRLAPVLAPTWPVPFPRAREARPCPTIRGVAIG